MPLVLLVEDDARVRAALTHALTDEGHAVQPVATGLDALREIAENRPDLVVLDLGLPDIDGIATLRMLRGICDVPVIVATARNAESDVIRLLNAGADDYLIKPFSSAHLAARIAAVLRRGRGTASVSRQRPPIRVGPLCIDFDRHAAELDGRWLKLTRREFDLLAYLAARAGRVVTRRELVTEVWQQPYAGTDQTLDVHISWLRRKLGETAARPRFLHTVRGVGIMLVEPKGDPPETRGRT
jgi:DNA-binding response OmpR family regulator